MTNQVHTFTLSIEPTVGETFQHGFHLGTDERLARQIAEEKFHMRNKAGMFTRSVALIRQGKLIDCFYGEWQNEAR